MGLSTNVNKSIPLPKVRFSIYHFSFPTMHHFVFFLQSRIQAEIEIDKLAEALAQGKSLEKPNPPKVKVRDALEKQAKEGEEYARKRKTGPILMQKDVQFCSEMIRRHGDDYNAMARDHLNIYQDTAKQIERKIATFKRSKIYKKLVEDEEMEQ